MSFNERVIEELLVLDMGKTCCRKALACGLFWGAELLENREIRSEFLIEEVAQYSSSILSKNFSSSPELQRVGRAGRYWFCVSAKTKVIWTVLQSADNSSDGRELSEIIGFKCSECAHAFLRGVFIAVGHINNPDKSYHAEFSVPNEVRAMRLSAFLSSELAEPKTVDRKGKIGVYYKRNMVITDLMYYLGGMKMAFEYSDACIMKDIRNRENRATNCVASNISKSVGVSQKHISAIEELTRTGRLFKLPEEIRYTARLRAENPSATLSELARLHEPPISKSGLNRRLNRILEELE